MRSADIQRELLKGAYKSKAWVAKVEKMSDAQVTAVIINLRKQNKL